MKRKVLLDSSAIGIVRVEICRGAPNEAEFMRLEDELSALPELPLGVTVFDQAANVAWQLQRAGLSVPMVDLLLAAAALVHDVELWHLNDAHFTMIEQVAPLRQRILQRIAPR